jgi:hypothetical protein
MENHDKLYDQFKNASQKAETKDFPSMDKVWNRVEEKLEAKVLTKKSNLWKKIAVAASIVAAASVGYQFLKSENKIVLPKNEITTVEAPKANTTEINSTENTIVTTEEQSSIIKKDAEKILQKEIDNKVEAVTTVSEIKKNKEDKKSEPLKPSKSLGYLSNNSGFILKGKIFDAIGVHHVTEQYSVTDTVKPKTVQMLKKTPPLVVINGEAIANKKKSGEKALTELEGDEIESVVVLKEPLYVINGVHYSEEELFGKKPTSPYAPLDKQEIKTITILQDQEAIEKYGEKGRKGVVIIATKTGKPALLK